MKIGILTFHSAPNFGAVYQVYALQEYIQSMGHQVYVLDYRPNYSIQIKVTSSEIKFNRLKGYFKSFFRSLVIFPIKYRRGRFFRRFRNRHLNIMDMSPANLADLDTIVIGSDQIWNTHITNGFDPIFWGNDNRLYGKRIISYAASAGSLDMIMGRKDIVSGLLNNFHAVGVREKNLFDFIKSIRKDCKQTLDPVLLCPLKTFKKISVMPTVDKPYLLLFQLGYDPDARRVAEKIALQKDLKIVEVLSQTISTKRRDVINAISPEKMLGLFENSEYIVSGSFHGTVLAIKYHKEFVYVQSHKQGGERVKNLLEELELSNRHIYELDCPIPNDRIDYSGVDVKISDLQINAKQFLNEALT